MKGDSCLVNNNFVISNHIIDKYIEIIQGWKRIFDMSQYIAYFNSVKCCIQ